MAEDEQDRYRRKFVGGVLEGAAQILGSMSGSVLVAGLVGPYLAALTGASKVSPSTLLEVAAVALAFAMVSGLGALLLRGLSRCVDDELAIATLLRKRVRARP